MDQDSTSSDESTGESFVREFEAAFPNLSSTTRMYRATRKPFHELGRKRRSSIRKRIKFVMQDYDRLLKTMGLCIGTIEVAPIETDEDQRAVVNNEFDFKIRPQGSAAIVDPNVDAPLDACLYFKDKHSMADRTYLELRTVCHLKVPNVSKIKARRREIDDTLQVRENEMGVYYSMRDKLASRLEAFFDRKYGLERIIDNNMFKDEIIHVKLSADGLF